MTSRSGSGESRADPGLSVIVSERHQLINFAFEVADAWIRHIWAVHNPDKLRRWRIAPLEEPSTKQDRLLPGPWRIKAMED